MSRNRGVWRLHLEAQTTLASQIGPRRRELVKHQSLASIAFQTEPEIPPQPVGIMVVS
jgi:hypothetical protein